MALIVLDASVAIAHLDATDALHGRAEEALLSSADDDLVLPASALAETLVVPTRRDALATARDALDELEIGVVPLTDAIAVRAAQIRAAHRAVRLPDALVIATADHLDAAALLTADRRWSGWSERVRLI